MSHDRIDYTFPQPRPSLTIEVSAGAKLGNCYSRTDYTVTSRTRLSLATLRGLFDLGVIGYGQGFRVTSQCDGKENPALLLQSECVMRDRFTKEIIPGVALNPYSGKPYRPAAYDYYVYTVECTCDSGG